MRPTGQRCYSAGFVAITGAACSFGSIAITIL